jgi:thioredoxin 1
METIFSRFKHLVGYLLILNCFTAVAMSEAEEPVDNTNQEKPTESQYSNDIFSRTGEISAKELITQYKIFANNYQKYQPIAEEINKFKRLDGFELVVFFGLWCHDSQREIPRLLKMIDQSNTYFKSIKLIALDPDKVLSEKFSSNYQVSNTPTIFVVDNRKVIAKIVESPDVSLSADLVGQIFGSKGGAKNESQTRK